MVELLSENYIDDITELRLKMLQEENEQDVIDEALITNIKSYINKHINKDLFIFGYIKDNKVIATASLLIHANYPSFDYLNGLKGRLSTVYTLNEYRNQGFQKLVLIKLLDFAKKLQLNVIKVNSNNPVAIKLYEHVGFIKAENCYKLPLSN